MATFIPRNRVPGAGSEPVEHQAIHPHRVRFQKVGWYHWASCSCGWIESGASAEDVSLRAANHDLRQMS